MSELNITAEEAIAAVRTAIEANRHITITIDGRVVVRRFGVMPLDAAWAEAEAALPEGWRLDGVGLSAFNIGGDTTWRAGAGRMQTELVALADTPAAALRALTAKLRDPR